MRPGPLKTQLGKDLRRWDQLGEIQRENLIQEASKQALAMRFATSISTQFPKDAGCAMGFLICLAVWAALSCVAFVWNAGLQVGVGVALAGPLIGGVVYQFIANRRIRWWTCEVLVPEARKSGVDLKQFAALLDNLPAPGPRSRDALSQLQEHAQTIP